MSMDNALLAILRRIGSLEELVGHLRATEVPRTSGYFANPMTTAGDLIVGGTSGAPTRVAKGAANTLFGTDGSANLGYQSSARASNFVALGGPYAAFQSADTINNGLRCYQVNTSIYWDVYAASSTLIFQLQGGGIFFQFDSVGTAYKPGGGSWTAISDRRVKDEIVPYEGGLALIEALPRPVRYVYNGRGGTPRGFHGVGFVAQELQPVCPEAVTAVTPVPSGSTADQDALPDQLGVDTTPIMFAALNAIKELSSQVQALTQRVTALEGQLNGA
jgi:hypothetical protein